MESEKTDLVEVQNKMALTKARESQSRERLLSGH